MDFVEYDEAIKTHEKCDPLVEANSDSDSASDDLEISNEKIKKIDNILRQEGLTPFSSKIAVQFLKVCRKSIWF